jgi:flagellar basal-body rod modification protein FlgD
MAVDNVTTQSSTGIDGNSYTSSVSNDQLTNDDFLKLMLEEMKMQDPTKPMDSAALMDSQLQMSTIQSNADMAAAMTALQASYASSALSTASNMIGRTVKDGTVDDSGDDKKYAVQTVENRDGELYINVREYTGTKDALQNTETETYVDYDDNGYIYEDGEKTDVRVSLSNDKRFNYNDDGSLKLLDTNSEVITDTAITDKYKFAGSFDLFSDTITTLPLNSVTEVS